VEWIATINAVAFQGAPDSGTDEFRYRILAALLANELKDSKPERTQAD
jgi:hypothetical protein